ncbi:acyl-CoA dehydrogenase family protein [Streptomyces sp. NPDC052236]|uniref:acyl-CoA dehydrogenase family protein n=1 Tax=Streptomyces sp. NPDC052236 TaxID=3365686 RepID=UPI0037D91520
MRGPAGSEDRPGPFVSLGHALQTLGGAGYTQDFPLEQYIRDTRIDTLYEGTTAIQGMDLFFRKIARDQGGALAALIAEVEKTAADAPKSRELADAHALLGRSAGHLQAMATGLGGHLLTSLEDPFGHPSGGTRHNPAADGGG